MRAARGDGQPSGLTDVTWTPWKWMRVRPRNTLTGQALLPHIPERVGRGESWDGCAPLQHVIEAFSEQLP